jgi:hypothetical protein
MEKPIKVTLDIFGVSLKLEFQSNFPVDSDYVAKISKTKAIKCYYAVAKRLMENNLPEDSVVSAKMSTCSFNNYHVQLTRYWKDDIGDCQSFDIFINTGYDDAYIRLSHNLLDWLRSQEKQKQQINKNSLLLTDDRKITYDNSPLALSGESL